MTGTRSLMTLSETRIGTDNKARESTIVAWP
jgi:hypothetical protein